MKDFIDGLKVGAQFVLWVVAVYGAVMSYFNFKVNQALKDYLVAKGLGE